MSLDEFSLIQTLKFKETIVGQWPSEVVLGIGNVNDFVTAEGRYHKAFSFLKPISTSSNTADHWKWISASEKLLATRPNNKYLQEVFEDLPQSFTVLLEHLVNTKTRREICLEIKIVTSNNGITKHVRPNWYISPTLHGLSIYLIQNIWIPWCNWPSQQLGFVQLIHTGTDVQRRTSSNVTVGDDAFLQFVFEFNVRILGAKGTSRSLGLIVNTRSKPNRRIPAEIRRASLMTDLLPNIN